MADFTSTRLLDKINYVDTYVNCITGLRPEGAKIPVTYTNDREALEAAIHTLGLIEPERARLIRIKNTKDLEELRVSEAYIKELDGNPQLQILSGPETMSFSPDGNLLS